MCIRKVKSVLGIDRFFSSPLFCQEEAGHFGLVGIGIEQEADGHEGKGAFIYDVRYFLGIFDLPTYPNQMVYYISLFSKIRCSLTYLPT